jgi:Zn-dependent oligopeptidase
MFPLISGKRLPDGAYQRPTVALICNFPTPGKDKPSLLSHDNVETLFHEFGHALHGILTQTRYTRFAGTSVPRDFVEAPSQMLENWIWDKTVLDSFAADYRDSSKKIPEAVLAKLKEAKKATIARHYRGQLSYGLVDLSLHSLTVEEAQIVEPVALSNQITEAVYLKPQENTAFVGYFGHLMGYDAGYYGYAWADSISADMATVFENAPDRYFDSTAGQRLRREIYEVGDSREVSESIEKFLGRPRSLKPFLQDLGILDE